MNWHQRQPNRLQLKLESLNECHFLSWSFLDTHFNLRKQQQRCPIVRHFFNCFFDCFNTITIQLQYNYSTIAYLKRTQLASITAQNRLPVQIQKRLDLHYRPQLLRQRFSNLILPPQLQTVRATELTTSVTYFVIFTIWYSFFPHRLMPILGVFLTSEISQTRHSFAAPTNNIPHSPLVTPSTNLLFCCFQTSKPDLLLASFDSSLQSLLIPTSATVFKTSSALRQKTSKHTKQVETNRQVSKSIDIHRVTN